MRNCLIAVPFERDRSYAMAGKFDRNIDPPLMMAFGVVREAVVREPMEAMFALSVESSALAPMFQKGDILVISPEVWTRSGDIAAVEYGHGETQVKGIMRVTYTEEFVVLESVNQKQAPIALVKGKDQFRIIGRVIQRVQKFS